MSWRVGTLFDALIIEKWLPQGAQEGGFVQIGQFQVANSIIKERDHGIQTKLKQSILH
jgi:hypothetical protein